MEAMKRSRLTRKTPLKRGTVPLRKTRLRPVSLKKAEWRQLYRMKWQAEARPVMLCQDCLGRFPLSMMHRHHPASQRGALIMVYVWICEECHTCIHDTGKVSRVLGKILPEFDGRKSTESTPNYFGVTLP
jgi:hypothetical protein